VSERRYELGALGLQYLAAALADGLTLARRLANLDFTQGHVFTFLPVAPKFSSVQQLSHGGVASLEASRAQLVRLCRDLVAPPDRLLLVFEHRYARPTDPWLANCRVRFATHGTEVYFLAKGADSTDSLLTTVATADTSPVSALAGFAVQDMTRWDEMREVSDKDISELAHGCRVVAASAFDSEGYVIWTPE
jgi:hypothetical protein